MAQTLTARGDSVQYVICAALCAFIAGGGVWYFRERDKILAASAQRPVRLVTLDDLVLRTPVVPEAPAPVPPVAPMAAQAAEPDLVARANALAELMKTGMLGRVAWYITEGNLDKSTASLAEFFGLGPEEAKILAEAVAGTRAEIARTALAGTKIERGGDQLMIDVPELETAAALDRMKLVFAAVLGKEKFGAAEALGLFSSYNTAVVSSVGSPMGVLLTVDLNRPPDAPATRVTITRGIDGAGNPVYSFVRALVNPARPAAIGFSFSPAQMTMDRAALLKSLSGLQTVIPADF